MKPAAPALPSRLYAELFFTLNFSVVFDVSKYYWAGAVPMLMRIVVPFLTLVGPVCGAPVLIHHLTRSHPLQALIK